MSQQAASIHYVVTVHGMGESREFETSRAMANLFGTALAARGASNAVAIDRAVPTPPDRRISLAAAADKRLWAEFQGIPQPGQKAGPFTGLPAGRTDGVQLRFVDIAWNDVLKEAFVDHGEAAEDWAEAALARLEARIPKAPVWTLRMLQHIRRAVIVLRRLMLGRAAEPLRVALDDYLGDVQMYGDHLPARRRAVRRFHEIMRSVEVKHREEFGRDGPSPAYTIVAHSLGTVMALDAIVFAHFKRSPGSARREGGQWGAHVQAFVTLGSPIDKFLLIWWYGFHQLKQPEKFARDGAKIRHFNYCDEQDPVGHNLDVVMQEPTFALLFEAVEDRVYNRYPIPGLAHLGYFQDAELFGRVYDLAVAGKAPDGQSFWWFQPAVYRKLLQYVYVVIPLVVTLANSGLLIWAWTATGVLQAIVASVAFVLVWFLGRLLIDLSIWWRQIQQAKYRPRHVEVHAERKKQGERFLAANRRFVVYYHVLLCEAACIWGGPRSWGADEGLRAAVIAIAIFGSYLIWRLFIFSKPSAADRLVVERLGARDALTVTLAFAVAVLGMWLSSMVSPLFAGHRVFFYATVVFGNAAVVATYVWRCIVGCKRDLGLQQDNAASDDAG